MKKHWVFPVVLFAVVASLLCAVTAHSGRTDSKGGHYDTFTGEYHYHHGMSAHQHPNGVCPYKSANGKSTASASSSKSQSSEQTQPGGVQAAEAEAADREAENSDGDKPKEKSFSTIIAYILGSVYVVLFVGVCLSCVIAGIVSSIRGRGKRRK